MFSYTSPLYRSQTSLSLSLSISQKRIQHPNTPKSLKLKRGGIRKDNKRKENFVLTFFCSFPCFYFFSLDATTGSSPSRHCPLCVCKRIQRTPRYFKHSVSRFIQNHLLPYHFLLLWLLFSVSTKLSIIFSLQGYFWYADSVANHTRLLHTTGAVKQNPSTITHATPQIQIAPPQPSNRREQKE